MHEHLRPWWPALPAALLILALPIVRLAGPVLASPEPAAADYVETLPGIDVSFKMVALPGTDPQVWIGENEVTWDEYELFYFGGADESSTPEVQRRVDAVSRPTPPYGAPDQGWGTGRRPALSMTLFAAGKYCEWLSALTGKTYRLPTREEWLLACEAGAVEPSRVEEAAWTLDNTRRRTMEVGTREATPRGVHDLLGNVAEFVAPDPADPGEPGRRSIPVFGGSYLSGAAEVACSAPQIIKEEDCLVTDPQFPKSRWWYSDCFHIGFRVVRVEP